MRPIAFCFAAALVGASAAPASADAFKPSKKDQLTLGRRAAAQIRRENRLLPDSDPKVQKLREIGRRLLAANPPAKGDPWEFTFDIVVNKEMNAFALPGGPIFFHSALFDKFQTEDQIAGVLAHEITHVTREHWAYAYADMQKRQLGLSLLLIFTKASKTAGDVLGIANDLIVTLPYMRKHETEADDRGFDTMILAEYNPSGMVDAFKTLVAGRTGSRPPEFLSTHPDTAKRIKRLEEKVAKTGRTFGPQRTVPWYAAPPNRASRPRSATKR